MNSPSSQAGPRCWLKRCRTPPSVLRPCFRHRRRDARKLWLSRPNRQNHFKGPSDDVGGPISLFALVRITLQSNYSRYLHSQTRSRDHLRQPERLPARSAALKAAIELDLFTEIARGNRGADAIAKTLSASTRGVRILFDYLVISGFLVKDAEEYSLTLDSWIGTRRHISAASPPFFSIRV